MSITRKSARMIVRHFLANLLRHGDRSRFGAPRLRCGQGCLSREDCENVKGCCGKWSKKRGRPVLIRGSLAKMIVWAPGLQGFRCGEREEL